VEGKGILSEVVVDKVMYRRFETVVLYLAYGRTGKLTLSSAGRSENGGGGAANFARF